MNLRGEEGEDDCAKGLSLREREYSGAVKRNTHIHLKKKNKNTKKTPGGNVTFVWEGNRFGFGSTVFPVLVEHLKWGF